MSTISPRPVPGRGRGERLPEVGALAVEERLRHFGFRDDAVEAVKGASTTSTSHGTPAAFSRSAYARSSSWNRSNVPTPIHAGGSPLRSVRRGGHRDIGVGIAEIGRPARTCCSTGSTGAGRDCQARRGGRCDRRASDTPTAGQQAPTRRGRGRRSARAAASPPPALAPPIATREGRPKAGPPTRSTPSSSPRPNGVGGRGPAVRCGTPSPGARDQQLVQRLPDGFNEALTGDNLASLSVSLQTALIAGGVALVLERGRRWRPAKPRRG